MEKVEQVEKYWFAAGKLCSRSVLPVLVEMSQFEQWVNITSLHKPGKSAVETIMNYNEVYGDKVLNNVLCITGTTDVNNGRGYNKMRGAVAGQQNEQL